MRLNSVLAHLSSVLVAVFLFFSVVFAVNMLRVPFYLGYKRFEANIVVFTPFVDGAVWGFSGLFGSAFLFFVLFRKSVNVSRLIFLVLFVLVVAASVSALVSSFDVNAVLALMGSALVFLGFSFWQAGFVFGGRKRLVFLVVLYAVLFLLFVEVASLGRWVVHLFSPSFVFSGDSWNVAFAEAQIWSVLYFVLPVLMMVFAFSWVGELAVKGFFGGETSGSSEKGYVVSWKSLLKPSLFVVLASVVIMFFVGYYHFAVSGLFNYGFPGTDVPYYVERLSEMRSMGVVDALGYASGNDRFLYLVLQYVCLVVSGLSAEVLVTFVMPVVLVFLLMFAAFWLVKSGGRNLFVASSCMLFTCFSFTTTVGMYAGYFANLFALFFAFVFYGFLLRVLNGRRGWLVLVLTVVFSVAVLFVHPWTWILVVVMNLATYSVVTVLLAVFGKSGFRSYRWELLFLFVLIVVNLFVFYVRRFLGVGGGAELIGGYVDVAKFQPSVFNVFAFKYFLDRTFDFYVGGFYGFVPLVVFAIVGVFSVSDYEDRFNRLLLSWLLIASCMVFVDFPWQARFLFDVPFNVYACFGVLFVADWLYRFFDRFGRRRLAVLVFWLFYVLCVLVLFNYVVRCMVLKQFGPSGLTVQP